MKILITGKDSYIGTSFEKWVARYGDAYIVDTIDVRDDSWKQKSFAGYDALLHVAGIAHINAKKVDDSLYYKVNRDLAVDVAVKAKQDGVKQFVFLSSMSVYGIEQGVITKDAICNPKSSYGKAKLEAEEIIHKLQDDSFSVATLRPPMVYGKGCKGNYPRLEKLALKLPIFPDIKNERSMIYIDNLNEFIKVLVDDCARGVFCPQNQEYVCTTQMVNSIADLQGRKIRLTKIFNPFLKLIKLNIITKVFGSLVYDKKLSEYQKKYCIYDFEKSIRMTGEIESMNNQGKEQELISIVMPAYNCEKYIEDSMKSVINQTYKHWELIVLDDGSKDNTVNIIKGLAIQDKRIKFYQNEKNQGVSATRNRGISLAQGEWIAFLDSDDMWQKEKLQKQISLKDKVKAEFVFTGSSYINEIGEFYKGIFEVPTQVDYKKLRTHNVISCSSVLVKKKFFENIKMEKDDMHEDYAVWLRILKQGVKAYAVNEPLLIYRISRNSKSGNKLKTIGMTYKVFRFIDINPIGSFYFMSRHVLNSVKKYRVIKR